MMNEPTPTKATCIEFVTYKVWIINGVKCAFDYYDHDKESAVFIKLDYTLIYVPAKLFGIAIAKYMSGSISVTIDL